MLIDFHMHAFPDPVAPKAVAKLSKIAQMPPNTDGTLADTLCKMADWGVDHAVLLNIATSPHQQQSILNWCEWIMENEGDRITPFASVHPKAEDRLEMLGRIHDMGIKGIKLHPDYQDFMIDDPDLFPIYQKCSDLGLIVTFHAGYDCMSPLKIHALPKASAAVAERFPELKMVLAHMGGMYRWDDVMRYLVGKNIYLDTSFSSRTIPASAAKEIIKCHGADKILFGSDCPWRSSAEDAAYIRSLGLQEEELACIFYKNAVKLLK